MRGIDHLVLCVRDLERAAAAYSRLGLTLTPPARHPWGTGNRLVQLERSFLELLAVVEPDRIRRAEPDGFSFGDFCERFLRRREGLAMLVFRTQDAEADRQAFEAAGLEAYPLFHFEREARLPDGASARVGFSLAFVTDRAMPDIAFFTCQQHNPEAFWKPRYQSHESGASSVPEVVMVADDPPSLGPFFAGLQGAEALRESSDRKGARLVVQCAESRLTVMTEDDFAATWGAEPAAGRGPRFVGFSLAVEEPDALAERLGALGLETLETDVGRVLPRFFGTALALVGEA